MLYVVNDVIDAVEQENKWTEFLSAIAQDLARSRNTIR